MITLKTKLGYESAKKNKNGTAQLLNMYPALKRYCRTLTRSNWDGEDLAHETIIKLFKSYLNKESTDKTVSLALMYKIAQNQWIDGIRKGSKEFKGTFYEPSYEPLKNFPEFFATIEKLVLNLTPHQTVIFILKDAFQFSLADIAEHVSMSEGAIKASLFRTRNRLKTLMRECEEREYVDQSEFGDETKELLLQTIIESIREENPNLLIEQFHLLIMSKVNSSDITPSCSAQHNLQLRAA